MTENSEPTQTPDSSRPDGADTEQAGLGSPVKDPKEWATGDEPATGPQQSYLETLAREAGEDAPVEPTKAQASEEIDRLQQQTGRGA